LHPLAGEPDRVQSESLGQTNENTAAISISL
jgi:hypothetical protein